MLTSSAVLLEPRNAEVGLSAFVDGRCRRTLSLLRDSALERVKFSIGFFAEIAHWTFALVHGVVNRERTTESKIIRLVG